MINLINLCEKFSYVLFVLKQEARKCECLAILMSWYCITNDKELDQLFLHPLLHTTRGQDNKIACNLTT